MERLVSSTPAGVRVEPEGYCKNAAWSIGMTVDIARNCGPSSVGCGVTEGSDKDAGKASTGKRRGRPRDGSAEKCVRPACADSELVSTNLGWQSANTAVRWSAWPGSFGS